jgi:hypothetical protein
MSVAGAEEEHIDVAGGSDTDAGLGRMAGSRGETWLEAMMLGSWTGPGEPRP